MSSAESRGGSRGVGIGIGLLVLAGVVMMVLTQLTPERRAFDLDSADVDGLGAIRILLEDRGIEARQIRSDDEGIEKLGMGAVLFVPVPQLATEIERERFQSAAKRGARVIYGTDPIDGAIGGVSDGFGPGQRELADTPIVDAAPGDCDLALFDDLGGIDVAFGDRPVGADVISKLAPEGRSPEDQRGQQSSCYGTKDAAWFRSALFGKGEIVVMGSPYLWVNSRLHPAKEDGGPVPDNAATAVRLLHRAVNGERATVTVIRAIPSPGVQIDGTKTPLELLPFGVKLGLAQLLGACGIYLWWRARRLGAPMVEPLPVEIAGSELVSAVGELRHRRGDIDRSAWVLRRDARRNLGIALGVAPTAPLKVLVDLVAQRTGRTPEQVHAALADAPVNNRDSLVKLAETLKSIRSEIQDVHAR
ncbi:MAG TPA: DUF4350 domain-containing protein [Microthrixaceae bacterium]|nr:DUF4350 domain-containing protein [Microthrixaceae bacterium]